MTYDPDHDKLMAALKRQASVTADAEASDLMQSAASVISLETGRRIAAERDLHDMAKSKKEASV